MHAQRQPSVQIARESTRLRQAAPSNVIPIRRASAPAVVSEPEGDSPVIPYQLPRPGEDGEPQVMSPAVADACLWLLAIGGLLVANLRMAGLV